MSAIEKLKALVEAINAEHSQAGMSAVQLARDTAIDALPQIVAALEALMDMSNRRASHVVLERALAALEAKLDA